MAKKTEKKTNGVFLNFRPEATIRLQKTAEGREFYNVSLPCPQSKTGWGSIGVNVNQVFASTSVKTHQPVAGYRNILLGNPDGTRQVSVCLKAETKKAPAKYGTITMTNAEIAAMVAAERKAYLDAKKA